VVIKPSHPAPSSTPAADGEASEKDDESAKGERLMRYLDDHAPDTHAALLRVSLQTGLPLALLRTPDKLSEEQFVQVEESIKRILGVERLNL
jgi:hypothetical protein